MRYCLIAILVLLFNPSLYSQQEIKGVVADSISRQGLAFATIKTTDQRNSLITGINGNFILKIAPNMGAVTISYAGYRTRTIPVGQLTNKDTIFLSPVIAALGEVIIRPDYDRVRRIINTAIKNKSAHNPDLYDIYQCNIYYKMTTDLVPSPAATDSAKSIRNREPQEDTGFNILSGNNHLLFSEVYSRRSYKRPQQLQEVVIASRFSGLKKTYFTNLVTDILPFHIYTDYITLNGKDYNNPVAKGWASRYTFRLLDVIIHNDDTTFILSFEPKKNVAFSGLTGSVYINTRGYAVSHFIGLATDQANEREVKIEQIYSYVNGKWFPRELNYDLVFKKYPLPTLGLRMNGHSIIDSVSYTRGRDFKIDKTYPVKLGDSVDLHSEQDWQRLRMDSLTVKESNTYRIIDSISEKVKIEKIFDKIGKLSFGFFPVGKFDIDLKRLIATNEYEGVRLGTGINTNELLSKYFSLGGWVGYGFRDKAFKYGWSATVYPNKNKDNWISFSYKRDYQSQGAIHLHKELDRMGFRNWILARVDDISEYAVMAHTQRGYWEIEMNGSAQKISSLYPVNFEYQGTLLKSFRSKELGLGFRYAYGEKRVPVFDYYLPVMTKYPIVYFRWGIGVIQNGIYKANFNRLLGGVTFKKHINRWGNDNFRLEAGAIIAGNNQPLPRSLLLAGNGFRTEGLNYYAWGGFLTIRPYDFFSDQYFSFLYKHDFDRYLWQSKYSKPFISLAHNLLYGVIQPENRVANPDLQTPVSGYHETGLLLNQLVQVNIVHAFNLYLNGGAFYHWTPDFDWTKNGVLVIGLSAGF